MVYLVFLIIHITINIINVTINIIIINKKFWCLQKYVKKFWERSKMVEEWMEATLNSSQNQFGITTKLWRKHPEKTTK